jgi:cob(I)alamin adenosyltransferase
MSEERFRGPQLAINRVYTKKGDAGETRLVGGQKVSKADLRIESYGTVDELNAIIGAAREACGAEGHQALVEILGRVQHALFNLGTVLATLPEDLSPAMPQVGALDVELLEHSIDAATARLPALRSFVLAGGSEANVRLHLGRTVCRRAERVVVGLAQREPELSPWPVRYLNRLSDALFVWSRQVILDAGLDEELWDPNRA